MNRFLYIFSVITAFTIIASCEKDEKKYTEAEAQYIVDSIYRNKTLPMIEEARKNFEYRNRIELKSPRKDTLDKKALPKVDTNITPNSNVDSMAG